MTEPQSLCDRSVVVEPDTGCPRQSHSAAWRGDVKDVRRGEEARHGRVRAHRRGAM